MSNPWDPNAAPEPTQPPPVPTPPPAAPGTPPPATQPPAAQPPAAPPGTPPPAAYATVPPSSGGGGGKGGKVAVGVVGVLLLGGAGAFALTNMGGSDAGGPADPEEAVHEVLEAVDSEDVLGLLSAIDPGERDALRDNAEQLLDNLERVEVLDSSFEATGIEGIDVTIDFDTIEYEAVEIREGLTRVEITAGELDYEIDLSALPTGDLVADLQDRFGGQDLDGGEHETLDFADLDEPFFLVARDTGDDGWRVSLGYTVAEAIRAEADFPDLEDGIDAIGEDSPEAAVEEFLRAFEGDSFDPEELIARLSPSELGALQEYLPTFIGSDAFETVDYDSMELAIDNLELSSEEDGNTASVSVDGFTMAVTETELEETVVLDFDGDCLTFDTSDAPSIDDTFESLPFGNEVCISEPLDLDEAVDDAVPDGIDLPEPPELGDLDFGEFTLQTAKFDGEWYIAPVDTVFTGANTFLDGIDRDTIESLVDYGTSLSELATSVFLNPDFDIDGPISNDPIEIDPDGPDADGPDADGPDVDVPDPDGDPDFDSIEPDPALGLSDTDLSNLQGVASYFGNDPDEIECAYEMMVQGQVDHEELLRSFNEDSSPSDEALAIFDQLEAECG